MRIAVTGAAGFIGSHLCERLLRAGHELLGLEAFTRFYAREVKERNVAELRGAPGFELRELNLLRAPTLASELAGVEAVVHLAGRPGVRGGSEEIFQLGNVETTAAVMRAAARAGVRRVVLASSSSVYGPATEPVAEEAPLRPVSRYGHSKARAEEVARELADGTDVELVVLRYFTVYGPRQRPDMAFARYLAAAARGELMPLLGDGSQRRDFTYVGDAVEGTLLALDAGRPGAVYNIAGGRPTTVSEAFALLAGAAGAHPTLDRQPADAREPRMTAADLGAARRELGYEPVTELADGIAEQASYEAAAAARP